MTDATTLIVTANDGTIADLVADALAELLLGERAR